LLTFYIGSDNMSWLIGGQDNMLERRRWGHLPRRIAHELNGLSGVAGAGGTITAVGALSILAGTAGLVVSGIGVALAVGAAGYAVYRAIPPKLRRPEEVVGIRITLSELETIHPVIPRLSIVGLSQSGKTTLRRSLALGTELIGRTQEISAQVLSLNTSPPIYVAVLDGSGERYAQQFKIAELCDLLCVVFDHNKSDVDPAVDDARLSDHDAFLKQIGHHLDESRSDKKKWIHFLFNKRDLWERTASDQREKFRRFQDEQVQKWQYGARAIMITHDPHSNTVMADVSRFMALLKERSSS
jgi:hypothetical protein